MELSEAWLRVLEKQREIRRQGNRQGKFSKATAALLRRGYEEKREFWNSGVFPGVCEREETFATRHADVPCRWFIPSSCPDPSVPIVYFHGGSYAVGNTRTHRRFLASMCESLKMNVLSVDYALSPDARYPVALEQIADVLTQLCAAPDAGSSVSAGRVSSPAGSSSAGRVFPPVGARPPSASVSAVVPAGDSAGANLALAAALYAHNMSLPVNVRALLLFYGGYGFSAESPDSLSDADLQYLYWYLCGREVLLPGVLEPDRPAGSASASAVAPAAASGADSSSPSPDLPSLALPSAGLPSLALPSAGPLHTRRRAEVCSRINAVGAPYMRLCRQSFPASFAPALIVCAQADPLCQNSLRLFRLLRSCGVSARYYCQKGVGHEYLQYGKWLPEVTQTIAECKKFLTDS